VVSWGGRDHKAENPRGESGEIPEIIRRVMLLFSSLCHRVGARELALSVDIRRRQVPAELCRMSCTYQPRCRDTVVGIQACARRACGHCISRTAVGETFSQVLRGGCMLGARTTLRERCSCCQWMATATSSTRRENGQTDRYSGPTVAGPVHGVSIVDHGGPENEE
jgi:hypothetical protein